MTYCYNNIGQPTGIEYSDSTRFTFAYDAIGNRTRMEDSTGITTYAYDALNRLQVITYPGEKSITYSYDEVGNRATMTDPDGGITSYSYDERSLLSSLENPSNELTTLAIRRIGQSYYYDSRQRRDCRIRL